MNINMKTKFVEGQLDELKTHIDRLFYQAQYGREEKAARFMKAYDYYLARLPAPLRPDAPNYVEPILRKAVDKLLPSLLNIFTENEEQAVVFRPQSILVPTPVADAVNKAINTYFLRENDGYKLMNRAFIEALVTGDCFVKVYIEEKTYEEEFIIEDWTPTEGLMPLLDEYPDTDPEFPDLEMEERKLDDQGNIIVVAKGKLDLVRIERKPRIEFVPFTEVYINGIIEDVRDTDYICHRRTVSIGQLLEMGFDKEKVENLSIHTGAASTSPLSTQRLLNMNVFVAEQWEKDLVTTDPMARNVTLFEHYVRTSLLDKKGKQKLYQVFSSGLEILEINEIERIPFAHGIIEELPGSFWGISLYDKFKASQDLLSEHHRAIMENARFNLYPAFQAIEGQYDRKSLLNMRPGAVIEMKQPGAVAHFPHSPLPIGLGDAYDKALQSVQDDMATHIGQGPVGGISATAVAASVHNAEMSDKKIAKALAQSLVRPMFELIYNIMRDEGLMFEVETEEGAMPVDASQLPKRSSFYIDVNTANDDAAQVQQLTSVMLTAMQLAQAPSTVVTPVNQYNIFKEILKRSDIHNVEDFLTDPTPPEPTPEEQAMQAQQQQMQMEQMALGNETAKANLQLMAAQIARAEVETDELIKEKAAERLRAQEKSMIEFQKLELKKQELEAEITIEGQQGRAVSIG